MVAHHGPISAPLEFVTPAVRGTAGGRCVLERRPIRVLDYQAESEEFPEGSAIARELGYHTILSVPLLREGVPLGVIVLRRSEVQAFSDRQITLLQTFADQAVIAIENTHLSRRNRRERASCRKSLEYQTATSEVLNVISRSKFDLQPVLDTIAKWAARLCDADHAWVFRREGDNYRWAAGYGHSKETYERIKEYMLARLISPGRGSLVGRVALEGRPVQIVDVLADPEYAWIGAQKVAHFRTTSGVPLLREMW